MTAIPLACDMTAIPAAERPAHQLVTRNLVAAAKEIREIDAGFRFVLSTDEFETVARFVAKERLCCPFLTFAIEMAPSGGALELRITGPDGVKDSLRAELHLPQHV